MSYMTGFTIKSTKNSKAYCVKDRQTDSYSIYVLVSNFILRSTASNDSEAMPLDRCRKCFPRSVAILPRTEKVAVRAVWVVRAGHVAGLHNDCLFWAVSV